MEERLKSSRIIAKLNKLSPKIDRLHVEGADTDLWIRLGEKRRGSAAPAATSRASSSSPLPIAAAPKAGLSFNQPLYRYGNKIEGIELEFKGGKVVKSSAKSNEKLLKEMIATPGANMVGEFSLTDKRFSRITKFMAETLFDENIGGPQGNTHIALGMSYKDTYAGNVSKFTHRKPRRSASTIPRCIPISSRRPSAR